VTTSKELPGNAVRDDLVELVETTRDAVRRSQRIASQLHQLIAASITVTSMRSEQDILRGLAGSTRSVFDAETAIVTLEIGSAAPLRGVAHRGQSALCEVPRPSETSNYPSKWHGGSETKFEDGWLVAPILEGRDQARGVVAVRRTANVDFVDEDKEVLALLAQMASSALGAAELGRTVQSSEARLRVLIETAPVGIVEADMTGRVRWWNRSASRVFAWPDFSDELDVSTTTFPEATLPALQELWSEVQRGGAVDGRDFVDVEIAGKMRVLSASAALLPPTRGEEPGILTLIDDVTNHRELKAELRHAYTMEIRGQVASRIAHDFNNLLTLISGYAEILSTDLVGDERSTQMVKEIQATASRASMLTSQLQTIGRTRPPETMVFNPAAVVQSNAEVLERVLGNAIAVRWSADEHAGNIRADVDQFEQMIINLSINARDAMPEGGELTIEVSAAVLDDAKFSDLGLRPGDYVVLSVTDTGVGMSEEVRARCFDPLFTTKGLFKGTGMGLSAARRLTEESGGAITCRSVVGEGTTFEVFLPSVDEEPVETFAVAELDRTHDTATVLIVDDDDELRRFMSRILERNGYRVVIADSAEAALEVVDGFIGNFDLLVSDFVMGEMSGRDLALALQAKNPALRVLIVSGTASRSVIDELSEGSAAFLAKPFKPSELVDNVHHLLARRH
jgi:two-component system, cell cycle sensor histidine kinase and response regulator CckA